MSSMVMMEIYNVNQYNESVIAPFINGSVSDNEKSFMLLSLGTTTALILSTRGARWGSG